MTYGGSKHGRGGRKRNKERVEGRERETLNNLNFDRMLM